MSQAAVMSLAKLTEAQGHTLGALNQRPKRHLVCKGLSQAGTSFWMQIAS
jgi:hypothetical protein